jgi:hypothetical protein
MPTSYAPWLSVAPAIVLVTAVLMPVAFRSFVARLVGLTGFHNLLKAGCETTRTAGQANL